MIIRKKPVIVSGVILEDSLQLSIKKVLEFMGQSVGIDEMSQNKFTEYCQIVAENDGMDIKTLEGVMKADFGDWIIKGVKGEFYPCKPDIFKMTYEVVTDDGQTESN